MLTQQSLAIGMLATLTLAASTAASAIEFKIEDTTASVYGYAKLDITYDVGDVKAGSGGLGNAIGFGNVAVGEQADASGQTSMHVYQSRIAVKTVTPTRADDLITVIEGDFYGNGGGDFRLRHAYGSWNGVTAGQTWTNFGSFVGDTPTLDFTGPVGRAGINRQAQLRYSFGDLHVALEAPNGTVSGSSFDGGDNLEGEPILNADRKDGLPDLTLRYESGGSNINYAAGALLRQVAFDDGENDGSTTGWGIFAGGNLMLGSGTTLRALAAGGDGIGSYLNNSPAPAAYRDGNELNSIFGWGGTLGLSQRLGSGSFNLAYSHVESDWDEATDAGLAVDSRDESRAITHLNYIWSPIDRVTYGVELAHVERETVAGDSGEALRLQGSVFYNF